MKRLKVIFNTINLFALVVSTFLLSNNVNAQGPRSTRPSITSVSPTSGPEGTLVTVDGLNFINATTVKLKNLSVPFTVVDSFTITFVVPVGATSGQVTVENPSGKDNGGRFIVTPPIPAPPTITSFSPTSDSVGNTVTINGTNFDNATSVTLNGQTVTFNIIDSVTIEFIVPIGATSGPIRVTNPDGTATSSTSFTVLMPYVPKPPTITSISPTSGLVGTTVTITGTNFSNVTSVKLNGTSVTFTIVNATSITFVVPAGATSGIVSVTNPDGTANGSTFTVTVPQPPTITSITPSSGLVGTTVTITGTNFNNATSVKLNGVNVTFTVVSATSITFTVPVGATSGTVSVTNPDGTANGPTFTVTVLNPPTITSITPTSGLVGTTVTITGTNFSTVTSVKLNGASVTFNIVSGTSITFVVPVGATSGIVSVTNPDGSANGPTFTVTVPTFPPTITSITPTSGPVGTTVTITGTNFSTVTAVKLNGTSVTYTIVSATSITFVVPAGGTTGVVSVTNPDGTANGPTYTVTVITPAPTITSISPTSGPIGTTVTVTGTNFTGATSVKLNGVSVTYTVVSATSITFTVPSGATTGTVSVTTPGGTATGPTFTVTTVTTLPTITRGAYMVGPTSSSINIQWRTDVASNSEVWYGTSPTSLTSVVNNVSSVTDHTITLTGLTANTKYYYSVGVIGAAIQTGTGNYFITAPISGATDPLRFWVTGDFGNASSNETATKNAFINYTSASTVNGWLWLGDNAYGSGLDAEYQTNVFNIYGNLFNRLPIFPAPGNHDYANVGYLSSTALGTNFPYFNIFAIPTNSGTEKYYSINYGNVHLISLDSYGSQNSLTSAMYTWLDNDLRNNKQPWVIVYWHHAPYTKGSHNSDTETELIDMRTNINPLLEQWGVDVVMSGHSHIYERSKFIKGHYGLASTFNNALYPTGNVVQSSTNTYTKASLRADGTVYTVCGVSGQTGGATSAGYPHPAMQVSTTSNNGSLIIDVSGGTLNVKFLTTAGTIFDQFTITKTGFAPRMGENDLPVISNESYYDVSGRFLGNEYKNLPTNQLIIYRYNKDGEPQVRKIVKVD